MRERKRECNRVKGWRGAVLFLVLLWGWREREMGGVLLHVRVMPSGKKLSSSVKQALEMGMTPRRL